MRKKNMEKSIFKRFSVIVGHVFFSISSERVTNVVFQTLFRLTGERQEVLLLEYMTL